MAADNLPIGSAKPKAPLCKRAANRYRCGMAGGDLGWTVDSRSTARVVAAVGRIDERTSAAFGEGLAAEVAAAADDGKALVVIDLAGIEYMSSRGLRGLTLAQRRATERSVTVVLARPGETMREILAISRYDMVFKVYETIEAALAS